MGGPREYSILFNYNEIVNSKNIIVLLGEVGAGKTTLLNKLTDGHFKTGRNTTSVTKDVQIVSSRDFESIIFDFPGFKALDDIIPTFKLQYRTIRNIPIKAICFIVERRDRFESIVDSLINLKETFDGYSNNIIVIITKTEEYDQSKKEECKKYIFDKTKFEKIIFTTKDTHPFELLHEINELKSNMEVLQEVKPKSREFLRYFKKATEDNMKRYKKEFTEEFEDTLEIFKDKFNEPSTDKALRRALFFAFKDYKNNLIEKYYDVAKREEEISDFVLEHVLSFSNEIYHQFDDFKKKVEEQIELNLTTYVGETNKFKKCPHCGTIWFRIAGCDGQTRCGTRDKIKDKFYGIYKDYIVKYENKNLEITQNNISQNEIGNLSEFNGLTNEEINKNRELQQQGKTLIKPIGCGNYIRWREMEDVTEEVNNLLKEIPNTDYDIKFREICKKEESLNFRNEIHDLESLI